MAIAKLEEIDVRIKGESESMLREFSQKPDDNGLVKHLCVNLARAVRSDPTDPHIFVMMDMIRKIRGRDNSVAYAGIAQLASAVRDRTNLRDDMDAVEERVHSQKALLAKLLHGPLSEEDLTIQNGIGNIAPKLKHLLWEEVVEMTEDGSYQLTKMGREVLEFEYGLAA